MGNSSVTYKALNHANDCTVVPYSKFYFSVVPYSKFLYFSDVPYSKFLLCHHGFLFQICIISLQFLIITNSYYFIVVPGTKFLLLHHRPLFQILIISLSFLIFKILIFHFDSSFQNCYNLTVVPYSKFLFFLCGSFYKCLLFQCGSLFQIIIISQLSLIPNYYYFCMVPCSKLPLLKQNAHHSTVISIHFT